MEYIQTSMFEGETKKKITKPVRLIELFGGYGSQALALKYLGVNFEHYKLSEWAIKSIQAYKDLHFSEDNTDYSKDLSVSEIKQWINGRISSDYSTPLTDEQIKRLSEKTARNIYNNMKACNNLGSITKLNGQELGITETDKYEYIMTYSFPCQDLSSAGKGGGMKKGSNTRSGLLWEVERLLNETKELPQVLLMENVPEVIGKKNISHFSEWIAFLDKKGYKSKWQILNAKDFGIPQNRARCFCVSVLGNYYYDFPAKVPLDYRLKDMLDKSVAENYYLSEENVQQLILHKEKHEAKGNGFGWKPTMGGVLQEPLQQKADIDQVATSLLSNKGKMFEAYTEIANTIMARDCKGFGNQPMNAVIELKNDQTIGGHILIGESETEMKEITCNRIATLTGGKWNKTLDYNRRVYAITHTSPAITTCSGGNTEVKVLVPITENEPIAELDIKNCRVRRLTEGESGKLMGVKPCDIDKIGSNLSKSAQRHCYGDSIVTTVLMGIFGKLFDIDYEAKIKQVQNNIIKGE